MKFFNRIRPMQKPLHSIGAQRDKTDNRHLHMGEYWVFVLMWMFNPVLASLRGFQ
jgi:hypothetical protein